MALDNQTKIVIGVIVVAVIALVLWGSSGSSPSTPTPTPTPTFTPTAVSSDSFCEDFALHMAIIRQAVSELADHARSGGINRVLSTDPLWVDEGITVSSGIKVAGEMLGEIELPPRAEYLRPTIEEVASNWESVGRLYGDGIRR